MVHLTSSTDTKYPDICTIPTKLQITLHFILSWPPVQIETAKSKEATHKRRRTARRSTFEEVQVDKKTSFIQLSTRILRLPPKGVAHSSCLERTRSTESYEE